MVKIFRFVKENNKHLIIIWTISFLPAKNLFVFIRVISILKKLDMRGTENFYCIIRPSSAGNRMTSGQRIRFNPANETDSIRPPVARHPGRARHLV